MKSYVFGLKDADIEKLAATSVFGVRLPPKSYAALYSTLADFAGFHAGDKVFFFQERKIYGVGEILGFGAQGSPLFLNSANALNARFDPQLERSPESVIDEKLDPQNWDSIDIVFAFKASPFFFRDGMDMDEVLGTPGFDGLPLRFFYRRSFVQLGHKDTVALQELFLRRFLNAKQPVKQMSLALPSVLQERLTKSQTQRFSLTDLVRRFESRFVEGGELQHESILHGLVIEAFGENKGFELPDSQHSAGMRRVDFFHEVPASPPKPPEYGFDRIDLMSACLLGGVDTPVHFEVLEAKCKSVPWSGQTADEHISQVMKYVDFVTKTWTGGNYAAVSAVLIASSFTDDFLKSKASIAVRKYVLNPREDPPTLEWSPSNMRLFVYEWKDGLKLKEMK